MPAAASRLPFVDALKAVASQLIVLHHLAYYGPMSDYAQELAPALISWLSQYARIAVQVFLVVGGFLAARSLAPEGSLLTAQPAALLKKRYLKLVIPYFAALLLSIALAAFARNLMTHDSIPDLPTLAQLVAHVLLLQSILEYDSLSAGVWYIAIDFQLFALLLGMLWLARKTGGQALFTGLLLIAGLMLASLFHFNRETSWDSWALYFFGAYALGVVAYWAAGAKQAAPLLLLIIAIAVTALLFDFRSRIAVAGIVAILLGIARWRGFLESQPESRLIAYLGEISYSVFLVHFPVCLAINALFSRFASDRPGSNAAGMLIAWAASIAAGGLFYRLVENRRAR